MNTRLNPDSDENAVMTAENERYKSAMHLQAQHDARIEHDTLCEMEQHGGGFVRALATAYRFADPDNRRRIKSAFPEIWERYSEMGAR